MFHHTAFAVFLTTGLALATAPPAQADGPGCWSQQPEVCLEEHGDGYGPRDCSEAPSYYTGATTLLVAAAEAGHDVDLLVRGSHDCTNLWGYYSQTSLEGQVQVCDAEACTRAQAWWTSWEGDFTAGGCETVMAASDGRTGLDEDQPLADLVGEGCPAGPPPDPGWGQLTR